MYDTNIKWFTSNGRSEAKRIKPVQIFVSSAVAPHARSQIGTAAGLSWHRNGVLRCPVSEPPGVTPIQAFLPSSEELLEGGQVRILLFTRFLGLVEVH